MKQRKTLIIAIILLLILMSVEVYVVKKASDYEPKIKVVYSKVKIPAGTVITKDMLIEKEVELSLVNIKAVKDMGEAVGKIAKIDIEEMEMITASRLVEYVEEKKLKMENPNNRFITIKFEPDQVNGWWIGDRVDILFVPDDNEYSAPKAIINNGQQEETNGKIIFDPSGIVRLENVRVAAIMDETRKLVENIEDTTYNPVLVSFEVDTEQDKFLAWAKHHGKIEVSARNESG
ncbi:Flp pilus assembly protein CpaB [Lutispora thermophila]|uniref:Flp pilus assembly protein CpaB n=1 Tax=Lutispora thermophila DSM 19022 TaxID=1122184 RepID=A0A1M6J9X0_9FIRM|nr:SAF domain-containing protein [Lutispora thermophila]SHJ43516.1 Flp pilus assembly protein CpaB [Lutispora thermophila DSM 19022]